MSFWGYVGPVLGNLGTRLGPCWVIWWAMWGSMEVSGWKKATPTENFLVEHGGLWAELKNIQPKTFWLCRIGHLTRIASGADGFT